MSPVERPRAQRPGRSSIASSIIAQLGRPGTLSLSHASRVRWSEFLCVGFSRPQHGIPKPVGSRHPPASAKPARRRLPSPASPFPLSRRQRAAQYLPIHLRLAPASQARSNLWPRSTHRQSSLPHRSVASLKRRPPARPCPLPSSLLRQTSPLLHQRRHAVPHRQPATQPDFPPHAVAGHVGVRGGERRLTASSSAARHSHYRPKTAPWPGPLQRVVSPPATVG